MDHRVDHLPHHARDRVRDCMVRGSQLVQSSWRFVTGSALGMPGITAGGMLFSIVSGRTKRRGENCNAVGFEAGAGVWGGDMASFAYSGARASGSHSFLASMDSLHRATRGPGTILHHLHRDMSMIVIVFRYTQ